MEKPLNRRIRLSGGLTIPALGLGCYKSCGDECYRAVRCALEIGCCHLDTAAFYGNEEIVGRALRDSGVPREEVTLVTKLWPTDYPRARQALGESLGRLSTYADIVLLHWPGTDEDLRRRAYEVLLSARERGEIGAAGVSNFLPAHLDALISTFGTARDLPVLNQIELHLWQQQRAVRAACARWGVAVSAWSPIMRGRFAEIPEVAQIAARRGVDGAQVLLAWHLAEGRIAVPKSVRPERIASNFRWDFALTDSELATLDGLDRNAGWSRDPNLYGGEVAR